ncbi:MAG: hypothetical protein WCK74_04465 [Gemmatimonadaceae bacterium]
MTEVPIETFLNVQSYQASLANFWSAFNSLEMILRIYLARRDGIGTADLMSQINAEEDKQVAESAVTDWSTFRNLCERYNNTVQSNSKFAFDEINRLRDALAHGRVTSDEHGNMIVIKYSKPQDGFVRVEYRRSLTSQFLTENAAYMLQAMQKVTACIDPFMKP